MQIGQLHIVETKQIKHRCMQIVNVQPVFDGMESQIIGRTDCLAPLDTAARHPHREAGRVVVAAISLFAHRSPAKLSAPDNERRIEQAAPLEILQQPRDRFVGAGKLLGVVLFDTSVGVPLTPSPMPQLNKPHSALHQPTRQQAHATERLRVLLIQAV